LTLLPRLYDASHGRIRLDDNDIRQVKLEHLRRQISYVPQEPFLFAGTIRDNITLGNPHVTPEELYAAADQAAILKDIEAFPANFETVVGEKGVILSGGQKQRIAIARALLKKSPVMLLDDPISQVDIRTGNRIIRTIASLSGTRTVIIVSHRLSALGFAHEIVTLKEGAIVETGTHDELVERGGYYARTFSLQEIEHAL
jgi:ATP-binding cassette subfamily B protein